MVSLGRGSSRSVVLGGIKETCLCGFSPLYASSEKKTQTIGGVHEPRDLSDSPKPPFFA